MSHLRSSAAAPLAALLFALPLGGCGLLAPTPVEYDPVELASGVVIHDRVVPEQGPRASVGDRVAIEYVLFLEDGTRVDSTADRGRPAKLTIGAGDVPPGVDEGLRGMRLYGQRAIFVPARQGYGSEGLPPLIPPDAALRFEVELMELDLEGERAVEAAASADG